MKKFLLKVILFFACVVLMDFTFGQVFLYLRTHAKGGSTANCEYIANQAKEDIIILGSSRATHHYVPQIIEDSIGLSCYNCGEEGNGVVLAYGRLKMLTNRYNPKVVLYEITPGFDYGIKETNEKYLGYLRAYYNIDGVKELFNVFDGDLSCLKMKSQMYQNTSRLLPDIIDNIIYRNNNKGYDPLQGHILSIPSFSDNHNFQKIEVDSLKLKYVEKIINLCKSKHITLLFMISPRFGINGNDMGLFEPALSLCCKNNIKVLNYLYCPSISNRLELFQDEGHMNYKGAEEYTKLICRELKHIIKPHSSYANL